MVSEGTHSPTYGKRNHLKNVKEELNCSLPLHLIIRTERRSNFTCSVITKHAALIGASSRIDLVEANNKIVMVKMSHTHLYMVYNKPRIYRHSCEKKNGS